MSNYFKALLVIVFITLNSLVMKAQVNKDFVDDNCIKKDLILIDIFYGWPYFNGTILQSAGNANNFSNIKNTNHLGGRVEYMLDEKIGIGGEFTYADASLTYQSTTYGKLEKAGVSKIRILGRFNYHFSTTKNIDPYFVFGAGYKKTTFYDSGNGSIDESFNLLPVSVKMALGMRLFFTDLIGMNAEIGLGGPLIIVGLSAKI